MVRGSLSHDFSRKRETYDLWTLAFLIPRTTDFYALRAPEILQPFEFRPLGLLSHALRVPKSGAFTQA